MNYYNPYFYTFPYVANTAPRTGLFSRLFGNSRITLSGILDSTQKALNVANQAIPLIKQVKPMIGNAKTMFKVMNEFKRVEKPDVKSAKKNTSNNINNNLNKNENISNNTIKDNEGPTFFM